MNMIGKISCAFTGGALGALIDSFNIWLLGALGITAWLGVGMKPEFTGPWLYPRLVWGGIWGLLFMLPLARDRTLLRGVLFSLAPSCLMLFVVFPDMGKGVMGLGFGTLTPVLVIALNFIWGITAAFWYQYGAGTRERSRTWKKR